MAVKKSANHHQTIKMVATPSTSSQTKGVVRQVIGPVLDVEFPAGKLPKILNALRIEAKNPAGQDIALTAEVQQLLGDHRVCLLYTSPSPRDPKTSRMPSSA